MASTRSSSVPLVVDELRADKQPLPAHLAEPRVVLRGVPEPAPDLLAYLGGVVEQVVGLDVLDGAQTADHRGDVPR